MMHLAEAVNRKIVAPGDLVAEGQFKVGPGAFKEGDSVYSSVIGLVDIRGKSVRVIALEGAYIPKSGDRVIALVVDVQFMGWMTYMRSPTPGILKVSEVPYNFDVIQDSPEDILKTHDLVYAEVLNVNELMQVKLTMNHPDLRKLVGGRIYTMSPAKVPRLIGRKGSMISMLKQAISRDILVGQNGIIWTRCSDEKRAKLFGEVLRKIEKEAHVAGLTNRIKAMLQEEVGIGQTRKTGNRRKKAGRKRSRRAKTD
jgi:exosome complex component RRP4